MRPVRSKRRLTFPKGLMKEPTHYTVHNGMFAKQDDFTRSTDQPFSILLGALFPGRREIFCKFLNRKRDRIHGSWFYPDITLFG